MPPCPWLVVADVSLMYSGNKIADAGLTELSTALKVNQAITHLNLDCKLWGGGGGGHLGCVCARAKEGVEPQGKGCVAGRAHSATAGGIGRVELNLGFTQGIVEGPCTVWF